MKSWIISKKKSREIQISKKILLPSEVMELRDDIKLPDIDENEALIKVHSAE